MIFITLGSREYQFNRLLKEVDLLIENGRISESVFAQIGQSDYIPRNYEFVRYLSAEDFSEYQDRANIIITHGGTGAITSALKKDKKIVVVPRISKFKEHSDDHQIEISQKFDSIGLVKTCYNIKKLGNAIDNIRKETARGFIKTGNIIEIITTFIEENHKK